MNREWDVFNPFEKRYISGCLGVLVLLGSCATTSPPVVSEKTTAAAPLVAPAASETKEATAKENVVAAAEPETTAETPESASLVDSNKVLFACRTAQDKVIEVYDLGDTIQYVFGPKEQPELVLDVPREQASTYQWQGIGRYEYYSVNIPNGETVYIVSWARDRIEINQPAEAGVSVEIDGEYVTTVDCATDITHNLIGVDLPPTPL
ncbi:MAG: hypothetical protein KTR27_12570 [Leptolyngbyaceae cyanobacterium MAG.088]|nr:hypothetical protein [Leptolyngbyaceae cyanobacterium MAG.088]